MFCSSASSPFHVPGLDALFIHLSYPIFHFIFSFTLLIYLLLYPADSLNFLQICMSGNKFLTLVQFQADFAVLGDLARLRNLSKLRLLTVSLTDLLSAFEAGFWVLGRLSFRPLDHTSVGCS